MRVRKNILRTLLLFIAVIICAFSLNAVSASAETQYLYLGGFPAGFTLNTTTVEVIGICDVLTDDGLKSPARESGIKTGDVIDKINGQEVRRTSDINKILAENFKKYQMTVIRDGELINLDFTPAVDLASGGKRLGVLVKDTINGIGTVTFIDKANNKFASLGHPVTDLKGNLVGINDGNVFGCVVYEVKRGTKGTPGELRGAFESTNLIGTAQINCHCGIYGELSPNYDTSKLTKIEKACMDEVKIGKACIYTTVEGIVTKKYDISIVKVDKNNKDNRNFVIKIEDDELIKKSGGIVQGMSGSPIVQNGKIIGAVTHVFINDPTRGYGIAIDKMLSSY